MKHAVLTGCIALMLPLAAFADEVVSPAKGSPDRKAMLDAMRPGVEAQVGAPVEFVVGELRVAGAFGFAQVSPQRPGGAEIVPSETPYGLELGPDGLDFWDCCHTEAVLERVDGQWTVREMVVGSTDVWYTNWCEQTPKGLIPICESLPEN